MDQKMKVNLIFGVLAGYVIIQFLWWAYLLLNLNTDYYHLKNELHLAWGVPGQADLESEFLNRRYMIVGEGLIFLLLLIVGIVFTARYIKLDAARTRLQRNFLLSVTHELKTPVAATQLYLQTLQKRKMDADQQSELVERALKSNNRLGRLVEKLLLATQLEKSGVELSNEEIELVSLIEHCVDTVQSIDPQQHVIRFVHPESRVLINGDLVAMETIFLNLLENAIKYSPPQSAIDVELSHTTSGSVIVITNVGAIPAGDQKHVFDKFFRSGNEETRSAKGTGVGLFLVKELAALRGGKVSVKSENEVVKFTLQLPVK